MYQIVGVWDKRHFRSCTAWYLDLRQAVNAGRRKKKWVMRDFDWAVVERMLANPAIQISQFSGSIINNRV